MKKPDWFERLEKRNEEVRHSKWFKIVMTIGWIIVALVMLAIFIAGKLYG